MYKEYGAYSCNHGRRENAVEAADSPHNFQLNHNLQKRKEGGEKKRVVVITRERKVGWLRIIRWEYKGGPNLRCNQASGPRSDLTCHFLILSCASEH